MKAWRDLAIGGLLFVCGYWAGCNHNSPDRPASPALTAEDLCRMYRSDKQRFIADHVGQIVTLTSRVVHVYADEPDRVIGFGFDCSSEIVHGNEKIMIFFRASKERPFNPSFLRYVDSMRKGLADNNVSVRGTIGIGKSGDLLIDNAEIP